MSHRLNATQLTVQYNGRNRMPDELGAVAWDSHGRKFRFVKSASVNTAGDVLGITSTATTAGAQGRGWRASRTASARNSRGAVGVAIAALSSSMYGWVQCAGPLGTFGPLPTKRSPTPSNPRSSQKTAPLISASRPNGRELCGPFIKIQFWVPVFLP